MCNVTFISGPINKHTGKTYSMAYNNKLTDNITSFLYTGFLQCSKIGHQVPGLTHTKNRMNTMCVKNATAVFNIRELSQEHLNNQEHNKRQIGGWFKDREMKDKQP